VLVEEHLELCPGWLWLMENVLSEGHWQGRHAQSIPDRRSSAEPALERVAQLPVGEGAPDPGLERMTALLGAVGDLLVGEPTAFGPDERDAVAVRGKVLAALETAGRSTLALLEQVPTTKGRGPGWRDGLGRLVEEAHRAGVDPPSRQGRYDDVAAVTTDSPTLAGTIRRWQSVAAEVLTPEAGAASSAAVQRVAADQAILAACTGQVFRAAALLGVVDADAGARAAEAFGEAGKAWRAAAAAWPQHVRAGGRDPEELRATSRMLRSALTALTRDGSGWLSAGRWGSGRIWSEVSST